jgi:acrylyl-CoA reductase (NADPH)
MSLPQKFKAMVVAESPDKQFTRAVTDKNMTELPDGDLTVEVRYSCLNYKDALSATGNKGVTRKYPHTPGIDAGGVVAESASPEFAPGEQIIVTGFDLGMNTSGGFGQYIRIPATWAVKLPPGLSLKESMAYGTAGFTAALAVWKMQQHGLDKTQGEILVTGATGGVGSAAVGILAKSGFHVVASTGKLGEKIFLTGLGAKEIISREEVDDASGRPLLKGRWAGVVDSVGGNILATAIRSTKYHGLVACCGNAASADFAANVYPFILRGASLLGIDSSQCAMDTRLLIWNKLSREWKLDFSGGLISECSLAELDEKIDSILQGKIRGRVVVDLQ